MTNFKMTWHSLLSVVKALSGGKVNSSPTSKRENLIRDTRAGVKVSHKVGVFTIGFIKGGVRFLG